MKSTFSVGEILPTTSRQSTVDKVNKLNQSTIDYVFNRVKDQLNDPSLGKGFVAEVLSKLGEAEIYNIANYAVRKGTHPGKVFVKICHNTMVRKGLK